MRAVVVGSSAVAQDILSLLLTHAHNAILIGIADESQAALLAAADWVVDVAGPDVEKQCRSLSEIARLSGADCIVTADSSVATRRELVAELPADFARRFTITHFFVPTKYMDLVEQIIAPDLPNAFNDDVQEFLTDALGRTVIKTNDMPGFVANRIGLFVLVRVMTEACRHRWPIDVTDSVISKELHLPRSGAFGLADLIGHSVLIELADQLIARLPRNDIWHECDTKAIISVLETTGLLEEGSRFYKRDAATKEKIVVRLIDGEFVDTAESKNISEISAFARQLKNQVRVYMQKISRESGVPAEELDRAMQLGFGWRSDAFASS